MKAAWLGYYTVERKEEKWSQIFRWFCIAASIAKNSPSGMFRIQRRIRLYDGKDGRDAWAALWRLIFSRLVVSRQIVSVLVTMLVRSQLT